MKFAAVLAVLLLCSCEAVEDPQPTDEPSGSAGQPARPGQPVDPAGSPHWNECDRYQIESVGGKVVEIPIPCNPYWRDKGDPPPDSVQNGRPDPEKQMTSVKVVAQVPN